jgi:Spy/CpxP family protein refolding chaperone
MKNIFTRITLLAGLVAILCAAALAQTTAPQEGINGGEGHRRLEGHKRRDGLMGNRGDRERTGGRKGVMARRALQRLNLSDAQREQLREIEARYGQGFKTQRQELRQLIELRQQGATLTPEQQQRAQQLRTQARDNSERMRAEILALLTPEQRDQLKRMREEGEARRKERREKFGQPNDNQ